MSIRPGVIAADLAAAAFALLTWTHAGPGYRLYGVDLDVYRIGARVWLSGGHLFGALPATSQGTRLPFTYPPVAAVVFSPASVIPMAVAFTLLSLAGIAALAVTLSAALRSLSPGTRLRAWGLARLLPLALVIEPVRSTLTYGQVNLLLMALVAVDCLAPATRWPRGMLTGLAAAVKLTPALFVLFFLVRRDFRAAGVAAASFLAATGLGFLLAPGDSARYWTSVVFDSGRIGNPMYAGNQSILGVLARAGLHPGTAAATGVWLALCGAVLAVAWLGMRRAFAAGEVVLALALNALAALLVSPVSWTHHWVWAVPVMIALAGTGRRVPQICAVCGVVIFAVSPMWWFPHGDLTELRWAAWQQVAGDSYAIYAVAVLLVCARVTRSGARPEAADAAGEAAVVADDSRLAKPAAVR
jgi:alpha-1,2-mannosyltransferase